VGTFLRHRVVIDDLLWGNTSYCLRLSGEDLSRYSNKIESVGLRKCQYNHYLTKKVMPLAPRMKKLRHCRPMYTSGSL